MTEGLTSNAHGEYEWKVTDGTFDRSANRLELQTSGKVHWDLRKGALEVTLSNLRLVIEGGESQIFVDAVSKSESGEMIDHRNTPLANLDLGAARVITEGDTSNWNGITSSLSLEGQSTFAGFYNTGALFDPVKVSYAGPGAKPDTARDDFQRPGSIELASVAANTADVPKGAHTILADPTRNTIHIATATTLRPYDATTLAPIAAASGVKLYNGWTGYPSPAAIEDSGTIVGNSGEKLVAVTWSPTTRRYTQKVLSDTPGTSFTYHAPLRAVYVASAAGISIVQDSDVSGPSISEFYPWAVWQAKFTRPVIAVGADDSLIMVDAAREPLLIRLVNESGARTAVVSTLNGDFSNERAVQVAFRFPTHVARDGSGFLLTNHQGRIYTVVPDAKLTYRRSDPIVEAGLNQVLGSTYDQATGTWYMSDWGASTVYGVRGTSHVSHTVPSIGTDRLDPMPVTAFNGQLYVAAARKEDNPAKFGLFSWRQAGQSPSVATQPAQPVVSLPSWDSTASTTRSVAATGTPTPTIQWQTRPVGATSVLSWTDIAGETNAELSVSLGLKDQGRQYRAILSNSVGRLGTEVQVVSVKTPPAIIFQPENTSVTVGQSAQFQVMPKGNPSPEVVWQRQVDGFWQTILADDENYAIDGGKLVVLDTNLRQSGSIFRARLRNELGTSYSSQAKLEVEVPSTIKRQIASGSVSWGVGESLRDYVVGPIAQGEITVAGGATLDDFGVVQWPAISGVYDPVTSTTTAQLGGSVQFTGHDGALDLTITKPTLTIKGDTSTLTADVASRDETTGSIVNYLGVIVGDVDASSGVVVDGNDMTITDLPAALNAASTQAFNGFYVAGAPLDPISASLRLGADVIDTPTKPIELAASTTTVELERPVFVYGSTTTATVKVTSGAAPTTGKITVKTAGQNITGVLEDGTATLELPRGITPGKWKAVVTFHGSSVAKSSQEEVAFRVTKADPRISVKFKKNRIKASQRAKLTVTTKIPGVAGSAMTGVVVVRQGSRIIAVKKLTAKSKGKFTLTLPKLSKGEHAVRASITSDSRHTSAVSGRKLIKVK